MCPYLNIPKEYKTKTVSSIQLTIDQIKKESVFWTSEYELFCTLNFVITFHVIIKQDLTFYITSKKSKIKLNECTSL